MKTTEQELQELRDRHAKALGLLDEIAGFWEKGASVHPGSELSVEVCVFLHNEKRREGVNAGTTGTKT